MKKVIIMAFVMLSVITYGTGSVAEIFNTANTIVIPYVGKIHCGGDRGAKFIEAVRTTVDKYEGRAAEINKAFEGKSQYEVRAHYTESYFFSDVSQNDHEITALYFATLVLHGLEGSRNTEEHRWRTEFAVKRDSGLSLLEDLRLEPAAMAAKCYLVQ